MQSEMEADVVKAIIFDFDGVITNTEPVHIESWLGVLEELGISFDDDEYNSNYLGFNDRDFLDALGRMHGHFFEEEEKARLTEEKSLATMRMLDRNIPLMPGIAEFVDAVKDKYLLAICSGTQKSEIEYVLRKLKWAGLFNPVISSESVKRGKPDPEGYIRAFEELSERSNDPILSEHVLAIEDSPKGVAAAKAAGLKCAAIRGTFAAEELSKADQVCQTINEINLSKI